MENVRRFWVAALGGLVLLETFANRWVAVIARSVRVTDAGGSIEGMCQGLVRLEAPTLELALARFREVACNPIGYDEQHVMYVANRTLGWPELERYTVAAVHAPPPVQLPELGAQTPAAGERPAHLPPWLAYVPGSPVATSGPAASSKPDWLADPGTSPRSQSADAGSSAGVTHFPYIPASALPPEVQAALEAQGAARATAALEHATPPGELVFDVPAIVAGETPVTQENPTS
jgi:hypothetical protein